MLFCYRTTAVFDRWCPRCVVPRWPCSRWTSVCWAETRPRCSQVRIYGFVLCSCLLWWCVILCPCAVVALIVSCLCLSFASCSSNSLCRCIFFFSEFVAKSHCLKILQLADNKIGEHVISMLLLLFGCVVVAPYFLVFVFGCDFEYRCCAVVPRKQPTHSFFLSP